MTRLLAQVKIDDVYFASHPAAKIFAGSFGSIISSLLPNIIVLAGVVFFILILFFGFGVLQKAGQPSSPQEMAKAKGALTSAVIGFLLVASSYFILQLVGSLLGLDFTYPML